MPGGPRLGAGESALFAPVAEAKAYHRTPIIAAWQQSVIRVAEVGRTGSGQQ
jgi:hypothetical protein